MRALTKEVIEISEKTQRWEGRGEVTAFGREIQEGGTHCIGERSVFEVKRWERIRASFYALIISVCNVHRLMSKKRQQKLMKRHCSLCVFNVCFFRCFKFALDFTAAAFSFLSLFFSCNLFFF